MSNALDASNSRRRLIVLVTMAVGVFACCGGLSYYAVVPLNGIRADRLEADLNAKLPVGSSREQAEAWFASHGLRPEGIGNSDGRPFGLMVLIPNSTLIENATIDIEVYFDNAGRVSRRLVRRLVVSL